MLADGKGRALPSSMAPRIPDGFSLGQGERGSFPGYPSAFPVSIAYRGEPVAIAVQGLSAWLWVGVGRLSGANGEASSLKRALLSLLTVPRLAP
jgi:hypothetical protein